MAARGLLILATLFFAAAPTLAFDDEAHGDEAQAAHGDEAHAAEEMTQQEMLNEIFLHLSPHYYLTDEHGEPLPLVDLGFVQIPWSNHQAALLLAGIVVLLAFGWLAASRRRNLAPIGALQNCLEVLVLFVRDEMVYPIMGKHYGRKYLPLFLSQFFCILVMNLMGLLPNFDFFHTLYIPTTATANINVTAGLAALTFTVVLVAGMKEQGVGAFWKNLAPHIDLGSSPAMKGMQVGIMGLLYPLEAIGLLIKHLALTIRLFANMTGGHLAMLTLYGLIYVFQSYLVAPVGVGFNVFLSFLELLVAFIQAYIFTFLSIIFVGSAVHPEH